jgi:hypothetical protein
VLAFCIENGVLTRSRQTITIQSHIRIESIIRGYTSVYEEGYRGEWNHLGNMNVDGLLSHGKSAIASTKL